MKKANPSKSLHHLTDRLAEVKGGARAVTIETGDPAASTSPTNPLTTSGG